METEGTNIYKHKQAGVHPVTARGLSETDIMFDHRVDIDRILDIYSQDYVVIEGHAEANCPSIATGITTEQVDRQIEDLTIGISGVISNELTEYRGFPVINATTDIVRLVDLIEAKTPERMPNYSADCCSACGTYCRGLTKRILDGSECILKGENVQVFINGEELPMVPFVKNIVRSVTTLVIQTLNGYEITVKIK